MMHDYTHTHKYTNITRFVSVVVLKDFHSGPQDCYFQKKLFFIMLSVLKLSTLSYTQAFLQASQ